MKIFQKILILLILQLFCIQQNSFAQDTLLVIKPVKHKFVAEPIRAAMLSVAFPGFGQIYNKKYWKVPLVYAGFGGLIYSAGQNSKNYNMFMKAYRDFTDVLPETNSYVSLISADPTTYDPVLHPGTYSASVASTYKDRMLRFIDYHRKYRDLSYIGLGVWYLITVLDANVDASLFNYDIGKNLDVAIVPVPMPLPGGFTGAGLNVSMKITF